MPVITIDTEISFNVADVEDAVIDSEVRRRQGVHDALKKEWEDALDPPDPSDFETSELLDILEDRNVEVFPWLERAYRMIAMGQNGEAMELIYAEAPCGLAPPLHREAHRRPPVWQQGSRPC